MKIIFRYLTKEVLTVMFAVTIVLLLLFLSDQVIRLLNYAASGKLPTGILWQLVGFEIPYLLSLLLPLGLYLSIILAYGRLYADNEIPVLFACGLSVNALFKIISVLAMGVMFFVLWLMLWVNPVIALKKEQLITNSMAGDNIFRTVIPGRFQISHDGNRVVYVESISHRNKQAHNLFIAEQKKMFGDPESAWTVVSAAKGYTEWDAEKKNHFLVAENGYRYEGIVGQHNYKVMQFKKYGIHIFDVIQKNSYQEKEAVPTLQLWKEYSDPTNAAELQWRISVAFSVFLLAWIAVPLSRVRPRQGRYAHFFPAILLYIVYINLLFIARNWVESKWIPISLGLWWVHGIFMLLGVALFLLQPGQFKNRLRMK